MNEDTTVTLIGIKMAKPGLEFIFKGKNPDCNGCKFKNSCFNLDIGGRYKIVEIRNASPLDCSVHEGGVQAVDVIKVPWTVLIESRKAINGSSITYEPVKCNINECIMYKLCHTPGIVIGDKYQIIKITGEPEEECLMGYSLKLVEIK